MAPDKLSCAGLRRRQAWLMVGLLVLLAHAVVSDTPTRSSVLIIAGPTQGYLEPCACGGQLAGGLARRAAMVAAARHEHPDLLLLDPGSLTTDLSRLPVIARTMAALGVAACGLSTEDLADWPAVHEALSAAGVPATSITPPLPGPDLPPAPPSALLLERPNGAVGVLSVAFGSLGLRDLVARCAGEAVRLRADGAGLLVLISHLGEAATTQCLAQLPQAAQPDVVAWVTEADEPRPAEVRQGVLWVPLARRGRSLSVLQPQPDSAWTTTQHLVQADGPTDDAVQGWVDEQVAQERTAEVADERDGGPVPISFAQPAACEPCHADAVNVWRQHPHAHAVETLEVIGRDVADCLRCHSERLRRDGVRPAPAAPGLDRGIQCATCHDNLTAHLAGAGIPTSIDVAGCETCHTAENSPHWQPERYWASVLAACQGRVVEHGQR